MTPEQRAELFEFEKFKKKQNDRLFKKTGKYYFQLSEKEKAKVDKQ
jgi:hypothetical protein